MVKSKLPSFAQILLKNVKLKVFLKVFQEKAAH